MLYVEVMYHFKEQVDFKISSKFIQALKRVKVHHRNQHNKSKPVLYAISLTVTLIENSSIYVTRWSDSVIKIGIV